MQSWRISRFNGQFHMLELCVARAGAGLASHFSSSDGFAVTKARREAAILGPVVQMHVVVYATALAAFAMLLSILL